MTKMKDKIKKSYSVKEVYNLGYVLTKKFVWQDASGDEFIYVLHRFDKSVDDCLNYRDSYIIEIPKNFKGEITLDTLVVESNYRLYFKNNDCNNRHSNVEQEMDYVSVLTLKKMGATFEEVLDTQANKLAVDIFYNGNVYRAQFDESFIGELRDDSYVLIQDECITIEQLIENDFFFQFNLKLNLKPEFEYDFTKFGYLDFNFLNVDRNFLLVYRLDEEYVQQRWNRKRKNKNDLPFEVMTVNLTDEVINYLKPSNYYGVKRFSGIYDLKIISQNSDNQEPYSLLIKLNTYGELKYGRQAKICNFINKDSSSKFCLFDYYCSQEYDYESLHSQVKKSEYNPFSNRYYSYGCPACQENPCMCSDPY